MKVLYAMIVSFLTLSAETYISGSIITNSTITDTNIHKGSGVIATQTIHGKEAFRKIYLNLAAEITILQSNTNRVSITTDKNLLDKFTIQTRNNALHVDSKESFQPTQSIKIIIHSSSIDEIHTEGAPTVLCSGIKTKQLSLIVDGASDITFEQSVIQKLLLTADGSYDIDASNNKLLEADIVAKGAGNIKLHVQNYLNVQLEDTVEVSYRGNPQVKQSINDVAELTHHK